jgi:ABC-type uncharacterized transport system permease subunit
MFFLDVNFAHIDNLEFWNFQSINVSILTTSVATKSTFLSLLVDNGINGGTRLYRKTNMLSTSVAMQFRILPTFKDHALVGFLNSWLDARK